MTDREALAPEMRAKQAAEYAVLEEKMTLFYKWPDGKGGVEWEPGAPPFWKETIHDDRAIVDVADAIRALAQKQMDQ